MEQCKYCGLDLKGHESDTAGICNREYCTRYDEGHSDAPFRAEYADGWYIEDRHGEGVVESMTENRKARGNTMLFVAAPYLLKMCKQYSIDCSTRIDSIVEDAEACGYDLEGLKENYDEDKQCEGSHYIVELERLYETRAELDKIIAEATN